MRINKIGYEFYITVNERKEPVAFGGISESGEIGGLYVDPLYRKQGYATKLIKFLEKRAKELGIKVVHTTTHHNNKATRELFKKLGYKEWIKLEKKL